MEDVVAGIERFNRSVIARQQGVGEIQRGAVTDKQKISRVGGFIFRGTFHKNTVTYKIAVDKLRVWVILKLLM